MGMAIDEAKNYLIALKHCETCEANDTNICKACPHYRRGSSAKCYDAIDIAIETMHKYQKIKEIVQHWIDEDLASESPSFADSGTIEDIIEVIEDGKTD